MKLTHKKRKLIIPSILHIAYNDYCVGAPITLLLRRYELDISGPALRKLLDYVSYSKTSEEYDTINNSIYPCWMDKKGDKVQESPDNWAYQGNFPFGEWVKDEDN